MRINSIIKIGKPCQLLATVAMPIFELERDSIEKNDLITEWLLSRRWPLQGLPSYYFRPTHALRVTTQKKDLAPCEAKSFCVVGRRGGIRTRDPLHPMQVRYQAALHAEDQDYSMKKAGLARVRKPRLLFIESTSARHPSCGQTSPLAAHLAVLASEFGCKAVQRR